MWYTIAGHIVRRQFNPKCMAILRGNKQIVSPTLQTLRTFHCSEKHCVDITKTSLGDDSAVSSSSSASIETEDKQILSACGPIPGEDDIDEEDEEYMFVEPHPILNTDKIEWGGPRRQGLPEPTRFGDWERKGRCTDF
uniref:Succinate dehydrogenase assembly factor 4, mitochondrial n=1 Tax=Proboscia inermis TaxID=420281 RepID=A0A7S0C435_9STRA|mmetsp:Transcript_25599/g.26014  ORF Transcript_25599/g.26014 Transcript_25599/m.26014 type:complete len:138 (+) Transcript_25599:64-477(+)|eukprot:CAMPEP_0171314192 /NCGR_PEP_ID=MMETSP0816-20121228/49758_1 /TAXON_ID=420281 /ORGANISM="Proboscia inermis, Strain CCAP1064/1" /LENGTH=137 /DNA_ID=CAMNT_0011802787 /DNA_START=53 /DNA_END=469 /DNA_ORIENTATION=-